METNENHALTKAEGCYHCKPLVQQRNELAAQVDRLRGILQDKTAEPVCCGNGSGDPQSGFSCCGCPDFTWPEDVVAVLSETPPAALAALKAQWQAEFAEEIAVNIGAGATFEEVIMMLDSAMRQRAQEPR